MKPTNRAISKVLREIPKLSNMVTENHIRIVLQNLAKVLRNGVPGDVVEMGCNVGTTSLYIQAFLRLTGSVKRYHVYDSFEGLPEPVEEDENTVERKFTKGMAGAKRDAFVENFKEQGLPLPKIHEGWFGEISDRQYPKRIAFCFFDGDFYTSIMDSFRKTYHKLSVGGIIAIHDYGWEVLPGVKRATEDFLMGRPEENTVVAEDHVGVIKKS